MPSERVTLTDDQVVVGRCATCIHWKFDEPDWEFDDLRFGECKAIRQREAIQADAVSPDERWTDEGEAKTKAALAAAKAIAVDGSGYYAAVRTAPDFGCILHTALTGKPSREGGET